MMKPRARKRNSLRAPAWASIFLVLSAVSCQAAPEEVEAPPAPASLDAPTPSPPPPAPQPEACALEQQESIRESITAQAEALTARDWESAYGFASPAFRAAVTIDQFERVITRQYDMLLYFEGAEFGPCEVLTSEMASISVEVRSAFYRPVIMVYEVVTSDGSWFVNGVDVPVSAVPNA